MLGPRPSILLTLLLCLGLGGAGLAQDFYDRGVLRTIELQFAQSDWETQLKDNKAAGLQAYIAADLAVDGVVYPNVGVRYKGNSSYWLTQSGEKKPFNIDLKVFGVDQEVLGNSKLILNNQWADNSLMREVIAYKVLNKFTPSSRANFVKVVINGDNYGIYTSVEHIGGKFSERWFGDGDGFRYKAVPPDFWPDTLDPPPPHRDLALQDLSGSLPRAEIAYELKNRELDPGHHLDVLAAIDVLNNTQSDLLVDALDPLFDTDNALWHLALNNAICTLDSYYDSGRNYYLYHDPRHDRLAILPWDNNMAFGNYGNSPWSHSPTAGVNDGNRPLMSKLVKGGVLRQEYLAHMRAIVDHALDPADLHAEINALQALIDAEVQIDTRLAINHSTWINGVNSLKNYVANRHDFLDTHSLLAVERPQYLEFGHSPAQPTSNDRVQFWARVENANDPIKAVYVYYRVAGVFKSLKLLDDGLNGDGAANDGLYGRDVAAFGFADRVEYFFRAKCTNSFAMTFAPDAASHGPMTFDVLWSAGDSDVLLNEVVARNNNGPTDEAGEHEDWIELHNHGQAAMDLSGMWLSDDLNVPQKWEIPAGTSLGAEGTLLIWADNEPLDGPLHASFKLSFGGEEVALYAADGVTLLDYLSFGAQEADVSTARLGDSQPLWVTLPTPTPAASNDLTCGVRAYDALDGARNTASITLLGDPRPGNTVSIRVGGFGAGQSLQLLLGVAAVVHDDHLSGLSLLIGNGINQFTLTADGSGAASMDLSIPPQAGLIGKSFYLQAGARGTAPVASHGLEVVICP